MTARLSLAIAAFDFLTFSSLRDCVAIAPRTNVILSASEESRIFLRLRKADPSLRVRMTQTRYSHDCDTVSERERNEVRVPPYRLIPSPSGRGLG
jgi:hypothetical protein